MDGTYVYYRPKKRYGKADTTTYTIKYLPRHNIIEDTGKMAPKI